jgi:hypothetical protein
MYVPEGYGTVFPYMLVKQADKFVEFLKNAFDARKIDRTDRPDGTIANSRARIGTSTFMVKPAREVSAPWQAPITCMSRTPTRPSRRPSPMAPRRYSTPWTCRTATARAEYHRSVWQHLVDLDSFGSRAVRLKGRTAVCKTLFEELQPAGDPTLKTRRWRSLRVAFRIRCSPSAQRRWPHRSTTSAICLRALTIPAICSEL